MQLQKSNPRREIFRFDETKARNLRACLDKIKITGLDGRCNMWIVKPSNQSRGRGIQVVSTLEEILRNVTVYYPKQFLESVLKNPLFASDGPLKLISWEHVEDVKSPRLSLIHI